MVLKHSFWFTWLCCSASPSTCIVIFRSLVMGADGVCTLEALLPLFKGGGGMLKFGRSWYLVDENIGSRTGWPWFPWFWLAALVEVCWFCHPQLGGGWWYCWQQSWQNFAISIHWFRICCFLWITCWQVVLSPVDAEDGWFRPFVLNADRPHVYVTCTWCIECSW